MNLSYKILNSFQISDELFKKFYSLIENSLLRCEYRSYKNQKALLKKSVYEILFCFEGSELLGAMAFWNLTDFLFIEHFAVCEAARNKGVGTSMLEFIKQRYNASIVLEVELPCNEINRRRISFYERNGFYYNDFEYFQKPLNEGDKPLPLRIMSYPKKISSQEFNKILKTLVNSVYNS